MDLGPGSQSEHLVDSLSMCLEHPETEIVVSYRKEGVRARVLFLSFRFRVV